LPDTAAAPHTAATMDLETDHPADRVVDARGLPCPHPVLQARDAMRELAAGSRILVLATDPLAGLDLRAWCLRAGHRLVEAEESGRERRYLIERA